MRVLATAVLVFAVNACGSGAPLDPGGTGGAGTGGGGGTGGDGTGGAGAGGAGMGGAAGGGSGGAVGVAGSTGAGGSSGSGGAGGSAHDGGGSSDAGGNDAPGACSQATTVTACDGLAGCHPVFFDPQTCGCASLGCCAHFMRCADGAVGQCQSPGLSCTIAQPHCEGSYVISYSNSCYEGCVRMIDC